MLHNLKGTVLQFLKSSLEKSATTTDASTCHCLDSMCLSFASMCPALSVQPVPTTFESPSLPRACSPLCWPPAPQPGQWLPCLISCLQMCRALCSGQLSEGGGSCHLSLVLAEQMHHGRIIYAHLSHDLPEAHQLGRLPLGLTRQTLSIEFLPC